VFTEFGWEGEEVVDSWWWIHVVSCGFLVVLSRRIVVEVHRSATLMVEMSLAQGGLDDVAGAGLHNLKPRPHNFMRALKLDFTCL